MNWQRLIPLISILIVTVFWSTGCQMGSNPGAIISPDTTDDTTGTDPNPDPSGIARVQIPTGSFYRGLSEIDPYNLIPLFPNAYPMQEIYLDGYSISKTEITNAQFAEFLNDGNAQYFYGCLLYTSDAADE